MENWCEIRQRILKENLGYWYDVFKRIKNPDYYKWCEDYWKVFDYIKIASWDVDKKDSLYKTIHEMAEKPLMRFVNDYVEYNTEGQKFVPFKADVNPRAVKKCKEQWDYIQYMYWWKFEGKVYHDLSMVGR